MSTTYHYANLSKREWFSAGAFGQSASLSGLGRSLSARAFDLLLVGGGGRMATGRIEVGYWAGDSVAIVGDRDENWSKYRDEFVVLDADVILLVYANDGFDEIAVAAERSEQLFMQLCHLVLTRQAPPLEMHMKQVFGADFLSRYKLLCSELRWFEPKDLGLAADS